MAIPAGHSQEDTILAEIKTVKMIIGVLAVLVKALARCRMPMLECTVSLGSDEHIGRLQGLGHGPPSYSSHWQC